MKALILSVINTLLLLKIVIADPKIKYDEINGGYTVRLERIPVNSSTLRKPRYPDNFFEEKIVKKPKDILENIS